MKSINPDETLYLHFDIEELEDRLEMGPWICGVNCPEADCKINTEETISEDTPVEESV